MTSKPITDDPARTVKKYEDLESDICDLRNMSDLASSYIEDSLSGLQKRTMIGDQRVVSITEREADMIVFSIYQVEKLVKELRAKFYAVSGEAPK